MRTRVPATPLALSLALHGAFAAWVALRASDRLPRIERPELAGGPQPESTVVPGPKTIVTGVQDWYEHPYGQSTKDERAVKTHPVPIVGGGFDLTDWAMRSNGQDPYYHRKLRMLDRTRSERSRIAANEQNENLRDSVAVRTLRIRRPRDARIPEATLRKSVTHIRADPGR